MFWRKPPEAPPPERATERANVVWWNRFKAERRDKPEDRWLKLYDPLPGILPPGVDAKQASLANDANIGQVYQGLLSGTGELGSAGLYWLGYPYLSELAQRAEYRNISQVFAEEMTREWIKFSVTGDKDKTQKIREIEEDFRAFKVQQHIRDAVMYDGLMGVSHIYPNLWGKNGPVRDDLTLLNEPLVLDRRSFAKGSLRGFVRIEAIWTYPAMYNAIDPLDPLFYKPASWYVMGKTVHRSRLLTVVSRPVPDLIKPAYMFGGISMTQLALPYIDRWLKTVGNVNRLINAFSVMVLSTNLSATLNAGGAADLDRRAEMFARYRDNFELFMTDKETEDFKNVTASIAGLSELQAQAQEHCASVARQPLVKYTGIQPAGLNASSEGELRTFYDTMAAMQEWALREPLETILKIVQLNRYGEIDEDIHFHFEPLWQLDSAGKAAVEKMWTDIDQQNIDMGTLSQEEVRTAMAAREESRYAGLDLHEPLPEPEPMQHEPGLSDPVATRIGREGAESSFTKANSGI